MVPARSTGSPLVGLVSNPRRPYPRKRTISPSSIGKRPPGRLGTPDAPASERDRVNMKMRRGAGAIAVAATSIVSTTAEASITGRSLTSSQSTPPARRWKSLFVSRASVNPGETAARKVRTFSPLRASRHRHRAASSNITASCGSMPPCSTSTLRTEGIQVSGSFSGKCSRKISRTRFSTGGSRDWIASSRRYVRSAASTGSPQPIPTAAFHVSRIRVSKKETGSVPARS